MILNEEEQHSFILDLIDDNLRGFASDSTMEVGVRAKNALGIIGLLMKEVPEFQLRTILGITGIDLWDDAQFQATSEVVTAFVDAGVIVVTDTFESSLVDYTTHLHSLASRDEDWQDHFAKVREDGVFFRTVHAPAMFAVGQQG